MYEPKLSRESAVPQEFTEYLSQVCQQIRWKKAHPSVRRELSGHMEDQMAEYCSAGIPPEEAVSKTIKEMGDPIQVGTGLDRSYRPKTDKGLLLAVGLLLVAGWLVQSVYYQSVDEIISPVSLLISIALGFCGMLAAIRVDYTVLAVSRKTGMIGYTLYNVLIFMLPIMYRFGGHSFFSFSLFSCAVHLFLLFPLAYCGVVYSFRGKGLSGFLFCGAMAAVSLFLMLTASFSAPALVLIPSLAVLIMAVKLDWFGFDAKREKVSAYLLMFIPLTVIFCVFLAMGWRPVSIIMDPSIAPRGKGYIYIAIRSVLGSSQWIGPTDVVVTPWGEQPIEQILPHNPDLLLTWTIVRLGWWTLCVIIPLALFVCLKGIHILRKQSGALGKMVSCAVVFTFAVQFLCFIQANLGLVFMVPYPFPFLQGNRSIVVNLILLGFLLSVGQRWGLDEAAPALVNDSAGRRTKPVTVSAQRYGKEIDISLKIFLPNVRENHTDHQ